MNASLVPSTVAVLALGARAEAVIPLTSRLVVIAKAG